MKKKVETSMLLYKHFTKYYNYNSMHVIIVLYSIIASFVIYIIFNLFKSILRSKQKSNKYVEKLKNALLSYALLQIGKTDNELNFDYSKFDGNLLPEFSGCSTPNACFTYILDKAEFKKNHFYSPRMMEKLNAIERYLDKNLCDEEKIKVFFETFVDFYDKKTVSTVE
jgi:hypothetical protein